MESGCASLPHPHDLWVTESDLRRTEVLEGTSVLKLASLVSTRVRKRVGDQQGKYGL